MLVLRRKNKESVFLHHPDGTNIEVKVVVNDGKEDDTQPQPRIKVCIEAPNHIYVRRAELPYRTPPKIK